jgi:hypothetical protein
MENARLPRPFRLEHLCELPTYLAVTELAVRPCVAFLHADGSSDGMATDVEESLIPRPNLDEVAAVFSGPFEKFLAGEEAAATGEPGCDAPLWYRGMWTTFHGETRRMHSFFVPGEDSASPAKCHKVFGLTARILVDVARIGYGRSPTFEHHRAMGDEDLAARLLEQDGIGIVKATKI